MKKNIIFATLFLVTSITIYNIFFCPPITPDDIICDYRSRSVVFEGKEKYFSAPSPDFMYHLIYSKKNLPEEFRDRFKERFSDMSFGLTEIALGHDSIAPLLEIDDIWLSKKRAILLTFAPEKESTKDTIVVNLNRRRHQFLLAWKQFAELLKDVSPEPFSYTIYRYVSKVRNYTSCFRLQNLEDSLDLKDFQEEFNQKKEQSPSNFVLNY